MLRVTLLAEHAPWKVGGFGAFPVRVLKVPCFVEYAYSVFP